VFTRVDELNNQASEYDVNRVLKEVRIKQNDIVSGRALEREQNNKNTEIAQMLNQMKKDPTKLSLLQYEDNDDPTNLKNTEIKEIIVHCVEETAEEEN